MWNYVDMEELAELKKGTVSYEGDFKKTMDENFTLYYHSLRPWMNRLRKVVFPNGGRREKDDIGLYSRMKKIFEKHGRTRRLQCRYKTIPSREFVRSGVA
jgi:hypothetical protein